MRDLDARFKRSGMTVSRSYLIRNPNLNSCKASKVNCVPIIASKVLFSCDKCLTTQRSKGSSWKRLLVNSPLHSIICTLSLSTHLSQIYV